MGRRVASLVDSNGLLVLLFTAFVAILLVVGQSLIVADSWMTLVSGREIWQHGFVTKDALTVFGAGREWIDQQWLAHLAFVGLEALGGLKLVLLANTVVIASAYAIGFAAARLEGATERSVLVVGLLAFVASPWAWQVRAQAFAIPLFVLTIWLLSSAQRSPSRRVLLVLPALVLWANMHGTVVVGALLAMAGGALLVLRRRGQRWVGVALVVLTPLCVLASPYALELPGYYHLLLVDPPFEGLIVEWQPTRPEGKTAVFFVLAAITAVLAVVQRRRLSLFDAIVLVFTFYLALDAIRGVTWFVLATLVIVPRLLDGALRWRQGAPRPGPNRLLGAVCAAGIVAGFAITVAQPRSWFVAGWPDAGVEAVAREIDRDPDARVYAMARWADWLLWRIPELRGRLAYDVRFEIYPRPVIQGTADFVVMKGDWARDADGFLVVVIDRKPRRDHARRLVEDGARRVVDTGRLIVLVRPRGA